MASGGLEGSDDDPGAVEHLGDSLILVKGEIKFFSLVFFDKCNGPFNSRGDKGTNTDSIAKRGH